MKHSRPLILLALAALLPLILLSAVLGATWLRQQQAALEQSALDRVERAAAVIERELSAQIQVLRALAQSSVLDVPLAGGLLDESAIRTAFARVQRELPLWRAVSLSDREGNRLVDVPLPIAGGRGKVVDPASHAQVLATGGPSIGTILRGPIGNAAFAIRVPVVRDDRILYVLSAVVAPDAVNRLLHANVPEDWRGAVIDSDGKLVARTYGDPGLIAQRASQSAQAARARGEAGVYESISLEGEALVSAYRLLPAWNWSVHIAMPSAVYHAPLTTSLWLLAGGAVLSLLLAGAFLALLAHEAEARRRAAAAAEEGWRMEALGRMTGGVAHDFNNLLMIAQSGAEAIKQRSGDPVRVAAHADSILAAVRRGEALTRQLLAFARRSPQAPVSFLMQERAGELLPLLERSTRADITTTLAVSENAWPIFADPNALEVALVNLAVNARDAMPEGGRLTVSVTNATQAPRRDRGAGTGNASLGGDYVAIRVEDTGTGIATEDLDRIFEPFYTTKPAGKGTGLGLSQVLGFAKQSGGTVTVDSRIGIGTVITLYLPRAATEPIRTVGHDMAIDVAGGVDGADGGDPDQGRVLLIEDNPEVARATEDMLVAAGYRVSWVSSGTAAMERIECGEAFDAVLSDIVLEGGPSGLELAPRLRAQRPHLPIVLMTGYSEVLAAGMPDSQKVLAKPFSQPDVTAALRAARAEARRRMAGLP